MKAGVNRKDLTEIRAGCPDTPWCTCYLYAVYIFACLLLRELSFASGKAQPGFHV